MLRKRNSFGQQPSGTQQAKHSIICGKCPDLQACKNHFKKRLCDKKDEITVELQDSDNAQILSGDDKDARCIFCNGSTAAVVSSRVTPFVPIS
jgi:hypothetical protein